MFTCEDCGRNFTKKQWYNYHIDNKSCKGLFCEVCGKYFKSKNYLNRHKEKCIEEKRSYLEIYNIDNNIYQCLYCNSEFTTKYSILRHMKKSCKKIDRSKYLENELEKKDKIIEELKKELEESKLLKNNDVNLVNNSYNNCVINNNQINNINNINITINGFGNENIDFLTKEDKISICEHGENSIYKCIKEIHMNPKYPENHNIMINKENNSIQIFDSNTNSWKKIDLDKCAKDLFSNNLDRVKLFKETCNKDISPINQQTLIKFINKCEKNSDYTFACYYIIHLLFDDKNYDNL